MLLYIVYNRVADPRLAARLHGGVWWAEQRSLLVTEPLALGTTMTATMMKGRNYKRFILYNTTKKEKKRKEKGTETETSGNTIC